MKFAQRTNTYNVMRQLTKRDRILMRPGLREGSFRGPNHKKKTQYSDQYFTKFTQRTFLLFMEVLSGGWRYSPSPELGPSIGGDV